MLNQLKDRRKMSALIPPLNWLLLTDVFHSRVFLYVFLHSYDYSMFSSESHSLDYSM